MSDEASDLEGIFGDDIIDDEPDVAGTLPDEEPPEEEVKAIDEELDELRENAPGVSPEDDTSEDSENTESAEEVDEEEVSEVDLDSLLGEKGDEGATQGENVLDDSGQFEALEEKARNESETFSRERFNEMVTLVGSMKDLEDTKSKIAFDQAELMGVFCDQDGWNALGYDSFSKFFRSDESPVQKSTAYRYRKVGRFMEDFPIGTESFDDQFYEDFDEVDKLVVKDENGNVDEDKTRQANDLTRRLRFTHVKDVASLFDNDDISHAKARELMRKSMNMSASDFAEEIDKHKKGRDSTITDELNDRGISGPSALVPLSNTEMAVQELRDLADRMESGEDLFNEILDDETTETLGSKSVTFKELDDGTLGVSV
jgi:hypothetical protein